MSLKFGDEVEVINGFFEGCKGIAEYEDFSMDKGYSYYIRGWKKDKHGIIKHFYENFNERQLRKIQ